MKQSGKIPDRIYGIVALQQQLRRWRLINKSIVFTNGVFDILHEGHIQVLSQAASFADVLIVGINSDASVKRLKGESRPVNNEQSRSLIMACLIMVDAVVMFEEDTPLDIINIIQPDVLVKGGDYTVDTIVGAKDVINSGGKVEIISLKEGFSTTNIIKKMKNNPVI